MLIIGLTGGISTGKSTVTTRLHHHHGIPVVDADLIARQVVAPGTRGYREILAYFQSLVTDLVNEDGTLNRPALGRAIFGKSEDAQRHRDRLNSIVHPAVRREMLKQVLWAWIRFESMIVLDIPLLFETGLYKFCGATVTVYCSKERQLARLMTRDGSTESQAQSRVDSQIDIEIKAERSDYVVDNEGDLDHLYYEVDQFVTTVRPYRLWAWLEILCPPFGLLMGAAVLGLRNLSSKSRASA
ncbi:CoaE-domain-containing protein [Nadsonia fulvescens var. elongata DSM 6958]|uniref:CoaE-domain-containing protein n=1 Tax=Nadsonia fulvescens var. elongata DSM 6958 TaxID=857566 RepID=A0A1E3PE73_9ASCO|nr:CoaE-domain-containing protein [Nadsonia fulvescens var. elongata DSM 6958]